MRNSKPHQKLHFSISTLILFLILNSLESIHAQHIFRSDIYAKGHVYLYAFEGDNRSGTAYLQARDKSNRSSIGLQLRSQINGSIRNALKIAPNGYVGIGTTNPKAELQLANTIKNRKIVLWQDNNDNDHSFYGFGINHHTLRYQSSFHHVFYSRASANSSKEVFRINNDGKIVIGQSELLSTGNGSSAALQISGGVTTAKVNAEFVDSKTVNTDVVDSKTITTELVDSDTVNTELIDSKTVNTEIVEIGNSKLSSTTENQNTLLEVTGGVKTDKVILNIGSFPDYVFADTYDLMSIEEVSDYIKKNNHLPNIPSEKEMVATGMDMRMITTKMMEKIEELTLYTIQQQEKLSRHEKIIQKQEELINRLLKNAENSKKE